MDKHCESPTAIYDSTAAAVANVHTAGAIAARHVRTASVKMTTMSAITSSTNADRCETGLPTICDLNRLRIPPRAPQERDPNRATRLFHRKRTWT